ncbi:MAG: DUF1028 domain-containing protein [Cryobacterium sp.]|nr:DUF1028 domain-containing protein [Cryobacterium sp.]
MTFSLLALSADGSFMAAAGSTRFLAIGSAAPMVVPGVGAVWSQAFTNPQLRFEMIRALRRGESVEQAIATVPLLDEGSAGRQVAVMDGRGSAAVFTGAETAEWHGAISAAGFSVQGNILVGPEVLDAMAAKLSVVPATEDVRQFGERLIGVLQAGQDAGGDQRGRQSAVLLVGRSQWAEGEPESLVIDLRVDDHPDPVPELRRLLDLWVPRA